MSTLFNTPAFLMVFSPSYHLPVSNLHYTLFTVISEFLSARMLHPHKQGTIFISMMYPKTLEHFRCSNNI
jgi:hypothetical protein